MRRRGDPLDFFGQLIEKGDRFFSGNPATVGTVIRVTGGVLDLELPRDQNGQRKMYKVKTPRWGVCLDKVPDDIPLP